MNNMEEIIILFNLCIILMLMFWYRQSPGTGALSAVSWFALGGLWNISSPVVYGLSLLFWGLGVSMALLSLVFGIRAWNRRSIEPF